MHVQVCVCSLCVKLWFYTGGSWSGGEGTGSVVKPPPNPGPQQQPPAAETPDIAYSMFPIENHELVHTRWEDDVIWDSEASQYLYCRHIVVLSAAQ